MSFLSRLPCLAFWAVLVLAAPALAREKSLPVELAAPAEGAALVGGSESELAWEPIGTVDRFPQVEEWEAFLSLDGGQTWPLRITPHLDQDVRHFRWRVPGVPTEDARILLRFGDEHEETAVELPARFSILAPTGGEKRVFDLAVSAPGPGEPALPGEAGVVAWVEGSRRGGSLRQVVAARPLSLSERLDAAVSHPMTAERAEESSSPDLSAPLDKQGSPAALGEPRSGLPAGSGPARVSDILLLIQRQNE